MSQIAYLVGNATEPVRKENEVAVIVQNLNAQGAIGGGFSGAVTEKWPKVEEMYLDFIDNTNLKERLGAVIYSWVVEKEIVVASIIAQYKGFKVAPNEILINYDELKKGFSDIIDIMSFIDKPYTIHMPRIGCGIAGGDWNIIEKIIEETFIKNDIDVIVYDLPRA